MLCITEEGDLDMLIMMQWSFCWSDEDWWCCRWWWVWVVRYFPHITHHTWRSRAHGWRMTIRCPWSYSCSRILNRIRIDNVVDGDGLGGGGYTHSTITHVGDIIWVDGGWSWDRGRWLIPLVCSCWLDWILLTVGDLFFGFFWLINWLIGWVGRYGGWGGNLGCGKMVDTVGLVDLIGFDVTDGWCVWIFFFFFFFDLIRSWVWLVCAWCTGRTLILLVWCIWLDLILLTVGGLFFIFVLLINWLIGWVGRCGGWGGNLGWWNMVDIVGLVDLIGFDVVDGWCVSILFFFFWSDQELGLIGVCLMRWKNVDTVGLVELIGFDIVDSWVGVFFFFFFIDWLIGELDVVVGGEVV